MKNASAGIPLPKPVHNIATHRQTTFSDVSYNFAP
jgi:hypothetical protein